MKSIYTAMEEIQQTQALKETKTTSNQIPAAANNYKLEFLVLTPNPQI